MGGYNSGNNKVYFSMNNYTTFIGKVEVSKGIKKILKVYKTDDNVYFIENGDTFILIDEEQVEAL